VEASATVSSPDPSEPPPARLIEATGLLHDIRVSLDARCETESEEDEGREIPWLGVGVALAAFLPTFLSIVLGGPLLLATAIPPARQGPALAQVGGPPLPTAPTELWTSCVTMRISFSYAARSEARSSSVSSSARNTARGWPRS